MSAALEGKAVGHVPHGLYWRFNRFLERHLPAGLYPRSLIIVIAPVVILQAIMAVVILDHYWQSVSSRLASSMAGEMDFIIAMYEASPRTPAAAEQLEAMASEHLGLDLDIQTGADLPQDTPQRLFSMLDYKLSRYVDRLDKPFWIDTAGMPGLVDVRVQVEPGTVFRFLAGHKDVYATKTYLFLWWLMGSSFVLLLLAVIFLRNQIRPILQLAQAAKSFGMGRDVPRFQPRGAAEVRQAATAFLKMKERIERHVEQRTAMLAGVSHDLRTILTRFKLQLALLEGASQLTPLKQDVEEMQRMLEAYMAFVRGDGGEHAKETDVPALLHEISDDMARSGRRIDVAVDAPLVVSAKTDALKRCLGNLVSNAARFATTVKLTGARHGSQLVLTVDDDGPGIPPAQREAVFRPFVRLDTARSQAAGGTGLGLAVARDIAHSHGGDIRLEDSPLGGLRAVVTIPV